jgi:hypothetical protein
MKKLILVLIFSVIFLIQVRGANRLPYITGMYAQTLSQDYILDIDYSVETRNAFKQHVLKYKPLATFQEIQVTESTYQEGKRLYMKQDTFFGSSGYTFFAGEVVIDLSTRTQIYSSSVVVCADILEVLIHEDSHCDGLGHEECNYRHIKFQGLWRRTQEYEYGNLLACGQMAYGASSFTPVDDWDLRRINNLPVQKARLTGTITFNNQPLKGANLIFISQTKTFKPTWRTLNQRFSTIVDILGDGDGSFEIELPPDLYKVAIVPIGNYDRNTHGIWRLSDSQIANISQPLFLNGKKSRFVENPATEGTLQLQNHEDLNYNWRI